MKTFQKNALYSLISITLAASLPFSSIAAPFTSSDTNQIEAPTRNTNIPKADFPIPSDGQVFMYGDFLPVFFMTPPNASAISLTHNGMELLYHPVPPGQDFMKMFFQQTYQPGKQTLILTLETENGQQFKQEKHYKVVTSNSRFAINYPSNNQRFSQGQPVLISFSQSALGEVESYLIRVDGEDEAVITKPPYEHIYQLDDPKSRMTISVISRDENDEELEEANVNINVNIFRQGVTVSPAIKEDSAAIKIGDKATFVADVRNDRSGKPLTAEEAEKQVKQVDFYIDGSVVATDNTQPYEYEWQPSNSINKSNYSTTYGVSLEVIPKDINSDSTLSKRKDVQIMPEAGRDYCNAKAPLWDAERTYQGNNELVRYNGFFYRANKESRNATPSHKMNENIWLETNCDNYILRDSKITLKIKAPKTAFLGEVVTVKGTTKAPRDITLAKLTVSENGVLPAREIKVNQDGSFAFEHRFKAQGQCYDKRCDTLDLEATNNLGFTSDAYTSISEELAPVISEIFTEEKYGKTYLRIYARDNSAPLKATVFNGNEQIAQGYMEEVRSYNSDGERVIVQTVALKLDLEPRDYSLTVIVADKEGGKTTQKAAITVPETDPVWNDWSY